MRLVLPRPVRRLLLPVVAVILLVLAAVFAVITVIATVLAPLGRRRRVLRMAAFALNYCIVELVVVFAAGLLYLRHVVAGRRRAGSETSWVNANQSLLAWALGRVLGAARRFLGFEVVVVETSDRTGLAGIDPVLVLARHGGPGDSFALVHLLLTRYNRGVRIVLKDILQLDPALDLLLNRLQCCFLASRFGRGAGRDGPPGADGDADSDRATPCCSSPKGPTGPRTVASGLSVTSGAVTRRRPPVPRH